MVKASVAAGPSTAGDSFVLCHGSGLGAVEPLTSVISSVRSSGQKLRPISAAAALPSAL